MTAIEKNGIHRRQFSTSSSPHGTSTRINRGAAAASAAAAVAVADDDCNRTLCTTPTGGHIVKRLINGADIKRAPGSATYASEAEIRRTDVRLRLAPSHNIVSVVIISYSGMRMNVTSSFT